ncbi:hypothetical protein GQY15_00650 [Rhodobacter sphaeroides]|uniref:hypothetical protein n=1 Tax=Cereibacter sphaeroides TaxID=1063 RepID=UPI00132729DE|nr:hypothetical protein [Cereibacter sphaeroides]MWP36108.1 hypothetical protein [Cereibacter sphaeroides]
MDDTAVEMAQPEPGLVPVPGSIRRTVLDWRDCWLSEAELMLHQEAHALIVDLEDVVFKKVKLPESLLGIRETTRNLIEQTLALWINEVQERLVDRAHAELRFALRNERLPEVAIADLAANRLVLSATPVLDQLKAAAEARNLSDLRNLVVRPSGSILSTVQAHVRALADDVVKRA